MNEVYFQTVFVAGEPLQDWPDEFAIITGYAPTGEIWTAAQNRMADQRLRDELSRRGVWMKRLTGQSPDGSHSEPGWAAAMPFEDACELGEQLQQVAIYHVSGDHLSVSYCDQRRRGLVSMGAFRERVSLRSG
jgi:hypothetical protein